MAPSDMQIANFQIYLCIYLILLLAGMLAAEVTFGVLNEGLDMNTYWDSLKNSWIWEELYKSRNYRPVSESIHCHYLFICISLSSSLKPYT